MIPRSRHFRVEKGAREGVGSLGVRVPGDVAGHVFDGAVDAAQLVADLDDGEADHARVEAEHAAHLLLHPDRPVELHDKVVALVVLGLMFRRRPRQVELAAVLDATDHASVVEDLLAGNSGDLFDMGEIPRADLLARRKVVSEKTSRVREKRPGGE